MKQIEFKGLSPDQIEVRPTDTKVKGSCTLLLYMNSRCAANIMDDTVGAYNWTMEYKAVGDKVFGRLSIFDEEREMWIYKEDTGCESCIEADKGLSSDILKRCIARWGCDFLYTAPKIKIKCPDSYYFNANGVERMTMVFSVKYIAYEGRRISQLTIVDRFDNVVFDWELGSKAESPRRSVERTVEQHSTAQINSNEEKLLEWREAKRGTIAEDKLCGFVDFYMRKDTKQNNGKTIVANWKGDFNPEERWQQWSMRSTRSAQRPN